MTARTLVASLGKHDDNDSRCNAVITKTWQGTFAEFVASVLKSVPTTADKASVGWISGAQFDKPRRHGDNFVARHFVSLDYDHIEPADVAKLREVFRGHAHLIYTTWSHTPEKPRLRVWVPLTRGVTADEFQAISRKVAARAGIELAARESHTPCQFMFRAAAQEGIAFQHWEDVDAPYLDADAVLAEYGDNWTDKASWPHRADGDHPTAADMVTSPLTKPGLIGAFNRTFTITDAIERFGLPYKPGSSEGRWTYTLGSRADGAVSYDDDAKLHVHHDSDICRGQNHSYDLVRLHRFGALDKDLPTDTPINERPSTRAMRELIRTELPEVVADAERAQSAEDTGFSNLDETEGPLPSVAPTTAPAKAEAPKAKGRQPLVFHKISRDILTRQLPPQRYALEPWFPCGTTSLLISMGGLGKTYLLLLLGICIALGLEFNGRRCTPARVVIVSGEDDKEELERRQQKVLRYLVETCGLVVDWDLLQANFDMVDRVGCGAENMMVEALSRGFVPTDFPAFLAEQIGTAALTVLDTKSRFASASDENDNAAGSAFIGACEIVATRTGGAVCILAHTGKAVAREGIVDQYSIRGASSLADDARSVMVLASPTEAQKKMYEFDPEVLELNGMFRLAHVKHNRSKKADDVFLERNLDTGVVTPFKPKKRYVMTEEERTWRLLGYIGTTTEMTSQRMKEEYKTIFGEKFAREGAIEIFQSAIREGLLTHTRTYNRAEYYKLSDGAVKTLRERPAAGESFDDGKDVAAADPAARAELAPEAEATPKLHKARKSRKAASEPTVAPAPQPVAEPAPAVPAANGHDASAKVRQRHVLRYPSVKAPGVCAAIKRLEIPIVGNTTRNDIVSITVDTPLAYAELQTKVAAEITNPRGA